MTCCLWHFGREMWHFGSSVTFRESVTFRGLYKGEHLSYTGNLKRRFSQIPFTEIRFAGFTQSNLSMPFPATALFNTKHVHFVILGKWILVVTYKPSPPWTNYFMQTLASNLFANSMDQLFEMIYQREQCDYNNIVFFVCFLW